MKSSTYDRFGAEYEYAKLALEYYRINGRSWDSTAALKRAAEKLEALRGD